MPGGLVMTFLVLLGVLFGMVFCPRITMMALVWQLGYPGVAFIAFLVWLVMHIAD
jgi:hypothetical protein